MPGSTAVASPLTLVIAGLGILGLAALFAVTGEGPNEDAYEGVAIVLGPLGLFVAVVGWQRRRRERLTASGGPPPPRPRG
jgi:hypothetical protein